MNLSIVFTLLFVLFTASPKEKPAANKAPAQTAPATSGKRTYLEYCAVCHGADARGMGPAASALTTQPADLTTLAKSHNGKFPAEFVTGIVRFGKPISAHGSVDMPVWGPIFSRRENGDEAAVGRRIKNLCDYLATLQEKES